MKWTLNDILKDSRTVSQTGSGPIGGSWFLPGQKSQDQVLWLLYSGFVEVVHQKEILKGCLGTTAQEASKILQNLSQF